MEEEEMQEIWDEIEDLKARVEHLEDLIEDREAQDWSPVGGPDTPMEPDTGDDYMI